MIDRYTKVLLTVIAVNLTVMTGWGALEVLVPEVKAYGAQEIFGTVKCSNCLTDFTFKTWSN